jgi:hypothetical protein
MVAAAVAVRARANPEGAVHSADPSTHRAADNPTDRSCGAVAAGRSFFGATEQALRLNS